MSGKYKHMEAHIVTNNIHRYVVLSPNILWYFGLLTKLKLAHITIFYFSLLPLSLFFTGFLDEKRSWES